jgi:hypothetical protein
MKLLFRLSGLLKILFIINVFLIDKYEESLFRNSNNHLFDNLKLDIDLQFPWYFYLFAMTILTGYLINLIVINLFSFKPCWRFSQYFHRLIQSRLIYAIEIVLLIGSFVIGYTKFDDAYSRRDYGIWGELLKPLFDPVEANNLHLIDKLNALNIIVPAIASIIILITFWKIRAANQIKCREVH